MMSHSNELIKTLQKIGWRLRLADGFILWQRWLWAASLGILLPLILGRLFPIERIWVISIWAFALWVLVLLAYSLFKPLSLQRIALRTDQTLKLKERISTSLELTLQPGKNPGFEPGLVQALHIDALQAAAQINIRQAFPLRRQTRPLLVGLAFLVLAAVAAFLPNPMDAVIESRKQAAKEIQAQAQKIEELAKKTEESKEMSPEEKEALLRQLAELAKALKNNPGDRQEALAQINQAEELLRQRMDIKNINSQAMLEAMAARLQALAGNPANTNPSDAGEALEKLAEMSGQMSEKERQELAANLALQANRAASSGDQSLAQALSALSKSVQNGDSAQAKQNAKAASQAMSKAAQKQANQSALQRALSALQSSRQSLTQNGQQRANNGQGQNGQNGQGQNPGQGQNGQGASGGGSRANQLPPGQGGSRRVNAPKGPGDKPEMGQLGQQVFVPREKTDSAGNPLTISGQDTGQGQENIQNSPNPLPGTNNPALVPYSQVFPTYLNAANTTLEQSYIPQNLKEYIRQYFTQLEP